MRKSRVKCYPRWTRWGRHRFGWPSGTREFAGLWAAFLRQPAGAFALGRFVMTGLVWASGNGRVYSAHDPDLNRKVVAKSDRTKGDWELQLRTVHSRGAGRLGANGVARALLTRCPGEWAARIALNQIDPQISCNTCGGSVSYIRFAVQTINRDSQQHFEYALHSILGK